VIVPVVEKTLEQDYNSNFYEVIVIADSFQGETLKLYANRPFQR